MLVMQTIIRRIGNKLRSLIPQLSSAGRKVKNWSKCDLKVVGAESQEKVSQFWAEAPAMEEKRLVAWMDHPHVLLHIQRRVTGSEAVDWCSYVQAKWFPRPVARALSLGCGEGPLERWLLQLGAVKHFEAIDISEGAIQKAREAAAQAGFAAN